jgi:GTP-binding protein HflX
VVALVGYTNAGKSTLFNTLTGAAVHAQDQLFATLDPTMRGLRLPSGRRVILSDTVGFISDLPTELVAAFRATLEEVAEADIILHVRDAAHPDTAAQRADVLAVLENMARDGTLDADFATRTIEVLNKADLLGGINALPSKPGSVAVSALTGDGLPELQAMLDARIAAGMEQASYDIAHADGARLAWLYEHGEVVGREDDEAAAHVTVRLLPADRARFERPHETAGHESGAS